jgi:hypothetical protein
MIIYFEEEKSNKIPVVPAQLFLFRNAVLPVSVRGVVLAASGRGADVGLG